jgi:hypothetical protein
MKRFIAVLLAVACVAGLSSYAFARDGHRGSSRGIVRDPIILGAPTPPVAAPANPIPAPLPAPSQAPVVNGPISQPSFRGLGGIGQ